MRNGKSHSAYCRLRLLIKIRLARWPCLPAFMNPEPLVRVKTDHPFNRRGEASRVHLDVFMMFPGSNQLDRWVAMKKIALLLFVPYRTSGNYYCIGLKCERGYACSGAGKLSKEGNKHSFMRLGVEIGENAQRSTFAQY